MKELGFIILMIGAFSIKCPDVLAVEMTSPISIKIEMVKEVFTTSEPIDGKIILTSLAPTGLHAIFDVDIYLNGSLQQSFFISFKSIFPGVDSFSFKDFNIHLPAQAGKWRVIIKQQGLGDDQAAIANLTVTS